MSPENKGLCNDWILTIDHTKADAV